MHRLKLDVWHEHGYGEEGRAELLEQEMFRAFGLFQCEAEGGR